jgi:RimJ/RimL family protein N-acetyltransferase
VEGVNGVSRSAELNATNEEVRTGRSSMSNEVRLRAVISSDLPIFFENQRDQAATAMAAFPSRDHATFTAHWERILAIETNIVLTILAGDDVAGNICCFERDGHWLIGYWLGREHWNKGIATRALVEFLRLVPIRPLRAHVAKSNLASFRVLQKCGFTVCGEEKGPGISGEEIEEFILELDSAPATSQHTHVG